MKKNNTKENTMKTYNYTHPRYFVDVFIEEENGRLRWVRNSFMSMKETRSLLLNLSLYSNVFNFNINSEEVLDKEALDSNGVRLGYNERENKFGSMYLDLHENLFDNLGFDKYVDFKE